MSIEESDVGTQGIASFGLFVSIDGLAAKKVATVAASARASSAVVRVWIQYEALINGAPQSHRFYSIGKDNGGKAEAAPIATFDFVRERCKFLKT